MKTRMKQLTAVTLLALLMVVGNVKAEGTEVKASSHDIYETKLVLENWMTDENVWNAKTFNWESVAADENLTIENWMTDENVWNTNSKITFSEDVESAMVLESWMTSKDIWNN